MFGMLFGPFCTPISAITAYRQKQNGGAHVWETASLTPKIRFF